MLTPLCSTLPVSTSPLWSTGRLPSSSTRTQAFLPKPTPPQTHALQVGVRTHTSFLILRIYPPRTHPSRPRRASIPAGLLASPSLRLRTRARWGLFLPARTAGPHHYPTASTPPVKAVSRPPPNGQPSSVFLITFLSKFVRFILVYFILRFKSTQKILVLPLCQEKNG